MPQEDDAEDDSPFPTLEEVEAMASGTAYTTRRKVLSSQLLLPSGNDEDSQIIDSLDMFIPNAVAPLYPLKENGDLIGKCTIRNQEFNMYMYVSYSLLYSTNFKCRIGLERGPPSLMRTIG